MVKEEEKQKVELKAHEVAEERVLDLLLPASSAEEGDGEAIDGHVCKRLGKNSRKCSAKARWTIASSISS